MWKALAFSSVLLMTGCASTIQSASIVEAYKKYDKQHYQRALELITRAENIKTTTPQMNAELTYLKAQTYERIGRNDAAVTLYEYLEEQHSDSQYGHMAGKKLESAL